MDKQWKKCLSDDETSSDLQIKLIKSKFLNYLKSYYVLSLFLFFIDLTFIKISNQKANSNRKTKISTMFE